MRHVPSSIDEGTTAVAVALAQRALSGGVVVYAGAGLSFAEPTGLPSGAKLSELIYARLRPSFPQLEQVDPSNLLAVADAVIQVPGGEDALRQTAAHSAEFTTASPAYGHQILALLLLEGAIDVLTTNWDNCIERGSAATLPAIINQHDLAHITQPSILKVHGCATQPSSLLVSTADLQSPPAWVTDQARARLGSAVVVFVGIGDVAGYIKERIQEALDDVGNVENVRVVSPSIVDAWAESQWSTLIPDLADVHKIAQTGDEFLEKLAGAYVTVVLMDTQSALADSAEVNAALQSASASVCKHDALRVLSWVRRCGVVATAGRSVLRTESMVSALVALGALTRDGFSITRDGLVQAQTASYDVLVAVGPQSSSRLDREARNRLETHLGNGTPEPIFLIAGGFGWTPTADTVPNDILANGDPKDIMDGPMHAIPKFLRAEEVSL